MKVKVLQTFMGQPDELQKYGGQHADENQYQNDYNPNPGLLLNKGIVMEVGRTRAEELISKGLAEEYKEKKSWF